MAFTSRQKITTTVTQNLVAAGDNAGNIRSIAFCNTNDVTPVSIDLHIYNSSAESYYIIKNKLVWPSEKFVLDTSAIGIDTSTSNDSLRVKCSDVSTTNPMNIIINV